MSVWMDRGGRRETRRRGVSGDEGSEDEGAREAVRRKGGADLAWEVNREIGDLV